MKPRHRNNDVDLHNEHSLRHRCKIKSVKTVCDELEARTNQACTTENTRKVEIVGDNMSELREGQTLAVWGFESSRDWCVLSEGG